MQVRRPKGISGEREAFVSRAAQASAAACIIEKEILVHRIVLFGQLFGCNLGNNQSNFS